MANQVFYNFVSALENVELTNNDIMNICKGDVDIVNFRSLSQYSSINQLFRKSNNVIIFWAVTEENNGHWTAIKYSNERITFFDPYGFSLDKVYSLAYFDNHVSNGRNYLMELINQSGLTFEWNTVRFQKMSNNINTCGRWSSIFIRFHYLSLLEFEKLFNVPSADTIASLMTCLFSDDKALVGYVNLN
jgi:hypothetical protein